ncbi:MAG: hypothetical protein FWG65_12520 [Turicibacter sp.]|nr:hypothetical protein [Turicibacter sp.]
MGRRVFKRTAGENIRALFMPLLFLFVTLGIVVYGLNQASEASREEARRTLEESLQRAIITSYAIEGRYPPTLEHIVNNFGIRIDESRFVVFYEVFASNIMPALAVIDLLD